MHKRVKMCASRLSISPLLLATNKKTKKRSKNAFEIRIKWRERERGEDVRVQRKAALARLLLRASTHTVPGHCFQAAIKLRLNTCSGGLCESRDRVKETLYTHTRFFFVLFKYCEYFFFQHYITDLKKKNTMCIVLARGA